MKTFQSTFIISAVLLLAALTLLSSCNKDDEFTIENKAVTGDFTYTRTALIPLTFDSTGLIPLSAQITMEGPGTVTDLGELYVVSTFKFNFVTGTGYDFVSTYSANSSSDAFGATATSQVQPNGSIIVIDQITSGTGKFSKISGNGSTVVWLNQAQDGGTGEVAWTVTY